MKASRKRRLNEIADINVTAFMNLMVILVPFLLVTSVFTQMTLIHLNIPESDAVPTSNTLVKSDIKLKLTKKMIFLTESTSEFEYESPWNGNYEKELSERLSILKEKSPTTKSIKLQIDNDIDYGLAIKIMDIAKSRLSIVNGSYVESELFPEISFVKSAR